MLSIRTQDRMSLVPYSEFIEIDEFVNFDDNKEYRLFLGDTRWLGTYATKERALKVLDEIEAHVSGKELVAMCRIENGEEVQFYDYQPTSSVYEMPKE